LTLGEYFEEQQKKKVRQELEQEQQEQPSTSQWWKSLSFNKKTKDKKQQNLKDDPISKLDDYQIEYYDDPNLLQNRPWYQRAVVLSGGVVFNLLLSLSIYFGTISTTGLPQPVFDNGVVVTAQVQSSSPALGKLERGDVITSINGTR
jgi:membrane-associated protease RseP (regulator of RpoE activity)